ncbi:MAG: hypothetical protein OEX08_03520 [Candidatus Nomurabacteria bacterium]|nr:hypothetical protein [Candidatus Nomurabacteria bacterium]
MVNTLGAHIYLTLMASLSLLEKTGLYNKTKKISCYSSLLSLAELREKCKPLPLDEERNFYILPTWVINVRFDITDHEALNLLRAHIDRNDFSHYRVVTTNHKEKRYEFFSASNRKRLLNSE